MATSSVIGALRVVLGADTATFEKGLKTAESGLSKFAKNVGTIAAGIGLEKALSGIISGIVSGMKSVFKEADDIGKAAQRIGITVEELSKLKYAADISDVSMEQLEKSATKLNKSIGDALSDKTSKTAMQFKALGIELRNSDGSIKSFSQVMVEMSDRFVGMSDGATKTSIAMGLMGKTGTQMIPMLNAGAKGIKELMKEAEDLGAVITTRVANSADRMSDDFKRLTTANKALSNSIIQELAPYMGILTDRFIKWMSEGQKASSVGLTIAESFLWIGEKVLILGANFVRTSREISAFAAQMKAFATLDAPAMEKAQEAMTAAGDEYRTRVFEIKGAMALLRQEAAKLGLELANAPSRATDFGNGLAGAKNQLDEFIKSQQKAVAAQQAETMTVGMAAGAKERLKFVMQAEAVARENAIMITDRQRIAITATANAIQDAELKQRGMNLLLEAAEPSEKFRLQMEQNAAALAKIGATSEQIGKVNEMVAEKFGATWHQATAGAAGGFAALANEMGKTNSEIAVAAKALAIVEATINTYVAFTKALASAPPPFNYIAAAGVLAAGMAKVIAIRSQSIPKMASGGTLIPNSFPGRDSTLMQARIRPDEQVDIVRPGEGSNLRRGGSSSEITLRVPAGAMREFWASGIEQINSLTSDGYRLKVAT